MTSIPFTLSQLIIFKYLAEFKSFKRAAENLYISQPAVSLQIQRLETNLNVQLVNRKGRKINLTEEGVLLLLYVEKILDACTEAEQMVTNANRQNKKTEQYVSQKKHPVRQNCNQVEHS